MDIDVNNLTSRIREILSQSDLATVSAKKVRRQLENELNTTLEMYKTDIDNIIKQQFQQIHTETQQRQQAQQQYAQHYGQMAAANNIYANGGQLPPGLQMPPGGGVIPGGMHAGMLPSHQQHAAGSMSPDAISAGGPRKRGRPRKTDAEKKLQRKKRELDPNRPKRQTGLSKPMKLSSDLSSFLGQKYCARTDVVKNLWKYIKANDLQDPSDKRYIMCDEKLKHLFDTDRLYMYTMNKLLNDHLIKPTPEENAEAIALLDLPPTHPAVVESAAAAASATEATQSTSATAGDGGDAKGDSNSPAPNDDNTPAPVSATTTNDSETKQDTSNTTTGPLALPPQPSSISGSVDTQSAPTSAGGDTGGGIQ